MTRAPLPGKLPGWPTYHPDPLDCESEIEAALMEYYRRLVAYWESRARLAVQTLEDCARWLENDADQDVVQRIITQIGPLPEEDRT